MSLKDIISSNQDQKIKTPDSQVSTRKISEKKGAFEGLKFSGVYLSKELNKRAYEIYDKFVSRLKTTESVSVEQLKETLPSFLNEFDIKDPSTRDEIIEFIIDNLKGYGPVSSIFRVSGDGLNDVIINTWQHIDIIYNGKTINTPYFFRDEKELRRAIDKMLAENNRKVDEAHPISSSKLYDGSRIEVQIPPVAAGGGSYATIRKFREMPLLIETLIDGDQMDLKMAYFLLKAIEGKLNIIVSGGTSSGKTTFLNALTRFISEDDQLLTIEDTKELKPQMPCHSVRAFEARPPNEEGKGEITLEYLLRSALRSSPRRIIVGECRGPEIVVMLNAMNTGHPGSMTTVHADDTKEAVIRVENMYLEARPSANSHFIRQQIVSAVDIIIQLVRFPDGSRKILKISELEKRMEEGGVVSLADIFEFKREAKDGDEKRIVGEHVPISVPNRCVKKMGLYGVTIDKRIFDEKFQITKEAVLEELAKYPPSRMCDWDSSFFDGIYKKDDGIIERWPNLRCLLD